MSRQFHRVAAVDAVRHRPDDLGGHHGAKRSASCWRGRWRDSRCTGARSSCSARSSIVNFGNGLLLPGAIAGAVSVRPQAAGTAAGIIGFTQMALGAAATQYAGTLMADSASAVPLALMMVALVAALAVSFGRAGAAALERPIVAPKQGETP